MNSEKSNRFNLVGMAEQRIKNFETVIQIPDEAKLLKANTMMLELYVQIKDRNLTSAPHVFKHLKYD